MNAPTQTRADMLRQLIDDTSRRETECQDFLQDANVLLTPPFSTVIQVVREQQGMAGNSDYFIIYEDVEGRRQGVLWEAKAPQLPPFTVETNDRLTPSSDLIAAENQLLYYFDDLKGNRQFRQRFDIRDESDIKLGGIIIGKNSDHVTPRRGIELTTQEISQLVRSARRIRDEYLYKGSIRLLSWENIFTVINR